jgi:spore coat protein U-like protein
MHRLVLAVTIVSAAFVAAAPALAGNLSSYDGASWYDKYLAVSSGAPTLCSSNSGDAPQLAFGNNVDASHECGSQSETSIAIDPANPNT